MNDHIKSWLFVGTQAILLLLLIFFTNSSSSPTPQAVIVGRLLELIGLILLFISFYDLRKSLTALPAPKKNGTLQIHGLYRFVRHPMYVAVLTLSLGIAVASGSMVKYLLVLGLYLLLSFKSRYEEKLLLTKYPGYEAYMKKTGRFLPTLSKL